MKRFLPFVALLLLPGCTSIPVQEVTIDAITAGGAAATTGASYRLLPKDPVLAKKKDDYAYAAACVEAALNARGMFSVPENAKPDLIIVIDYGLVTTAIPGAVRLNEHFLQLAASKYNPAAAAKNYKGEQIWDIRVSIPKPDDQLMRLMPILASGASMFAGLEHAPDSKLRLKENNSLIVAVKSAAATKKP